MSQKRICLILALITTACYAPIRHADFINLDDPPYVYDNPQVQRGVTADGIAWAFKAGLFFSTPHVDYWQPLTVLSHMLDVTCFGMNPHAQHLVNLALHVANTLLLFGVFSKITHSKRRSALVALLFAVHPLHIESVAWITERKDVLSAFFWILALGCYPRYASSKTWTNYVRVCFLFACSLMAKPAGLTFPFILLLMDVWPLERFRDEQGISLIFEKIPLLALSAASACITFLEQGKHLGSGARPLAGVLNGYLHYLTQTLVPLKLSIWHPPFSEISTARVVIASALLLGVSLWVCRDLRTRPFLFVGWFWFVGMLIPTIRLKDIAWAERFTYLPLIGIFIMISWSLPSPSILSRPKRQLLGLGTAGTVILLCILTFQQAHSWQNSVTLYQHALTIHPDAPLIQNNLGLALMQAKQEKKARAHFEQAIRLKPEMAEAWDNLGLIAIQEGKLDESLRCHTRAVLLKPDFSTAHEHLAYALAQEGNKSEAMVHYQEALRLEPSSTLALCNLGSLLSQTGKAHDAMQLYQRGLKLNPDDPDLLNNLGALFLRGGLSSQARDCFDHAIQSRPSFSEAHASLATILALQGEHAKAVDHYRIALQTKPDDIVTQYNLANSLLELQQDDEAQALLKKVAGQGANLELARRASDLLAQKSLYPPNRIRKESP